MSDIPDITPLRRSRGGSSPPSFEELLEQLCRQAAGDVHLDLAEMDDLDAYGVITLIRAATTLVPGRHLMLHNPPESVCRIVALLGSAAGDTGLRLA